MTDTADDRATADELARTQLAASIRLAWHGYETAVRAAWAAYRAAEADAWERRRAAVDTAYAAHRPGAVPPDSGPPGAGEAPPGIAYPSSAALEAAADWARKALPPGPDGTNAVADDFERAAREAAARQSGIPEVHHEHPIAY